MSKYYKNIPCPKCRENGNDRTGDNLTLYNDGSGYCWKCHYYILSDNIISNYKAKQSTPKEIVMPKILLPKDCTSEYSEKCVTWIEQYHLGKLDLLYNGVLYSESGISFKYIDEIIPANNLLIFPFWQGEILNGYQARYFGNDKRIPKWIGKGDIQSIVHILKNGRVGHDENDASRLVLCEDIVSAIKVSKLGISAMPLFGVNIKARIPQFRVLSYLEYIIFLDEDMHQHSVKESLTMRLNGFNVKSILSECDPKEYSYKQLKEILL